MAAIGTSVTEILHTLRHIKAVYDAFFNKHQKAEKRLQELERLVDVIHGNFSEHSRFLESRGLTYPLHNDFISTLKECEDFLKQYESVRTRTDGSGVKRFYLTVLYPEEKDRIDGLEKQLNRHSTQIIIFNLSILVLV